MSKIAAVLELPGKGTFAPVCVGSRYGNFLKTDIPGQKRPSWIFESRLYDISKAGDRKAFNDMCAKVIPNCHQRKLRVIPRFVELPAKPKAKRAKRKTNAETEMKEAVATATPTPPALTPPPSGS